MLELNCFTYYFLSEILKSERMLVVRRIVVTSVRLFLSLSNSRHLLFTSK